MPGRHLAARSSWRAALGRRCSQVTRPLFTYVQWWEPWSHRSASAASKPPLRMIDAGPRVVRPRPPSDAVTTTLRIGDVTLVMHRAVVPTVVAGRVLAESWQVDGSDAVDQRVTPGPP